MNKYDEANRKIVADATRVILATLNGSSVEIVQAGILDELNSSHRTLQQLFVKATLGALHEYGQDGFCDARNSASKAYCKDLETPAFPYI